jgi:hypothetical protein
MKNNDLPPNIASRLREMELHVDTPKKVMALHASVETEHGLGFSPGALARKVPTTVPPRELQTPLSDHRCYLRAQSS